MVNGVSKLAGLQLTSARVNRSGIAGNRREENVCSNGSLLTCRSES